MLFSPYSQLILKVFVCLFVCLIHIYGQSTERSLWQKAKRN